MQPCRALPGSGCAAGGASALPLDVVVQPEAGFTGGLHGALLQLPVGQGWPGNRVVAPQQGDSLQVWGALPGDCQNLLCNGCEGQVHVEARLGAGLHEGQSILLQTAAASQVAAWWGQPKPSSPRDTPGPPPYPGSPWPASPHPPSSPHAPGQSPPGTGVLVRAGPGLTRPLIPPVEPGRRGEVGVLTLFPSSISTTLCWAYSWISVSQACGGKAETSVEAVTPAHPLPLQATLHGGPVELWLTGGAQK